MDPHVDPPAEPRAETAAWRLDRIEGGVRIGGQLRIADAPALVKAVREATVGMKDPLLDLTPAEQLDGGVLALMRAELGEIGCKPAQVRVPDRFRGILDLYPEVAPCTSTERRPESTLARLGRGAVQVATKLTDVLAFAGQTVVAAGRLLRSPGHANWRDVPLLFEQAGADAIPIVVVINFLLGFVLAYMGARALQTFGANLYVADIVGIGMTRQLGPLMTAIIVCGRSGASYAAELGSMKVDQEIDALRTLGLEPFAWLVMPRLLSLFLVVPVLTVFADLVGMLGGWTVAVTSLGLSSHTYLRELRSATTPWDAESGLIMSITFALAIGLIACEHGFHASGGPQGVGKGTTSTVVTSLFALVFLDAAMTILYRELGLS